MYIVVFHRNTWTDEGFLKHSDLIYMHTTEGLPVPLLTKLLNYAKETINTNMTQALMCSNTMFTQMHLSSWLRSVQIGSKIYPSSHKHASLIWPRILNTYCRNKLKIMYV